MYTDIWPNRSHHAERICRPAKHCDAARRDCEKATQELRFCSRPRQTLSSQAKDFWHPYHIRVVTQ